MTTPEDDHHRKLVDEAKGLYDKHFITSNGKATTISVAPGRVNLIGEHVDYTGGFVLPFAIEYAAVVYGRGTVTSKKDRAGDNSDKDGDDNNMPHTGHTTASVKFISAQKADDVHSFDLNLSSSKPPSADETKWTTYVIGTIMQYLPDLPSGSHLSLTFSLSGNVPLGSGLSSSAALEVAVARFVEAILGDHALSSDPSFQSSDKVFSPAKIRALRCQKAENEWCHSPCGIMDQAISSAAPKSGGCLLLIDCRTLEFQETVMATTISPKTPVLVVTNSNVKHDIAGGEYPVRVAQCKTATEALQNLDNELIQLRDATPELVEQAHDSGLFQDEISYKRAKHVTTENQRTLDAKSALEAGDWTLVGQLMNASHDSMRDDYEVSCEEIDLLVNLAQSYEGVYGSRLTGGGFGGCTVTLVDPEKASGLMDHLRTQYKLQSNSECDSFVTRPARGAHLLSINTLQPLI